MNFLEGLFKKDNLIPRIIALVVACVLWAYVMMEQNPFIERYYQVPLKIHNLAPNRAIFNAPDVVTVQVRGSRLLLDNNADEAIDAYIDLRDMSVGQHKLAVHAHFKKGDVVNVLPKEVNVLVDHIVEKSMPVVATVVGNYDEDLTIDSSNGIKPEKVVIKGASTQISKVDQVIAPVNIQGQREDFQAECILDVVDQEGEHVYGVQIMPDKAVVDAVIVRKIVNVDLPVRIVVSGELTEGLHLSQIYVQPDKVRVTAPPSVIKDMQEISTKPIDISTLTNDATVVAELDVPDKVIPEFKKINVLFKVERQ